MQYTSILQSVPKSFCRKLQLFFISLIYSLCTTLPCILPDNQPFSRFFAPKWNGMEHWHQSASVLCSKNPPSLFLQLHPSSSVHFHLWSTPPGQCAHLLLFHSHHPKIPERKRLITSNPSRTIFQNDLSEYTTVDYLERHKMLIDK